METGYCVVLVTAKNFEEARKISQTLLNDKLAACVNIIKDVQSVFWWQGKIDEATEALLVVKTLKAHFTELMARVKEVHSYDVPEIIALPVIQGNPDYLEWIKTSIA